MRQDSFRTRTWLLRCLVCNVCRIAMRKPGAELKPWCGHRVIHHLPAFNYENFHHQHGCLCRDASMSLGTGKPTRHSSTATDLLTHSTRGTMGRRGDRWTTTGKLVERVRSSEREEREGEGGRGRSSFRNVTHQAAIETNAAELLHGGADSTLRDGRVPGRVRIGFGERQHSFE